MPNQQTGVITHSAEEFLASIAGEVRHRDRLTVRSLMRSATQCEPKMWTVCLVDFGTYRLLAHVVLFLALAIGSTHGAARAQQGPTNLRELEFATAFQESSKLLRDLDGITDSTKRKETIRRTLEASDTPFATECLLDFLEAKENRRKVGNQVPLRSFGCSDQGNLLYTAAAANEFFGSQEVGNAVALSFGDQQAALYTEILSDNVWVASRLGFARIGLSGQVSAAPDSASETTVTQFFQGGGNAVLYVAYPYAAWLNYQGNPADSTATPPRLIRRLTGTFMLATGADIPQMSTAASELAGNIRVGTTVQGFWGTDQGLFRFFGQADGYLVTGLSDSFYENLLGPSGDEDDYRPFLSGAVTVGVDLAERVRLGVRFGGTTLENVSQKAQFTLQVLPEGLNRRP